MFFCIFWLLVGVLGILVASMRSGVKFCAEWCCREVEGTILDSFCEKNVRNVSAPKYANAEYMDFGGFGMDLGMIFEGFGWIS